MVVVWNEGYDLNERNCVLLCLKEARENDLAHSYAVPFSIL